jgi:hypothetical protein
MENAPSNNSSTSSDVKKDILAALAALVWQRPKEERGLAPFCLLADESRDNGKHEQMVMGMRFVKIRIGILCERMHDIIHAPDTCATTLKDSILASAAHHNLDMKR